MSDQERLDRLEKIVEQIAGILERMDKQISAIDLHLRGVHGEAK